MDRVRRRGKVVLRKETLYKFRGGGGGGGGGGNKKKKKKSHGQRTVVGYSPCGHKESDTIEPAYTHTHTHTRAKPCTKWLFS